LPAPDSSVQLLAQHAPRAEVAHVPFDPQEDHQCGPAALSMAFGFAGVERSPQQLRADVYVPDRGGSLQVEMLAATRRAGLVAYPLPANLDALLQELEAGRPVVVLQNLMLERLPIWHYAVAIGYDLGTRQLILHSGAHEHYLMRLADFDRTWARSRRWAFLALVPGQIPATATAAMYDSSVANLERVHPDKARVAYESGLARWPEDLVARIGLGNIAYNEHRLDVAEEQYRKATQAHADSADAWNNLAQVLHEGGHDDEAITAAERAIAIGGPRVDSYRSTLDAIQKR
jgi:tetratricopeptide (TPR) repeat protein